MATHTRNTTPRRATPRTESRSRTEDEVVYLCTVSRSRSGLEIIDLTNEETNEVGQDIDHTPAVQDSNSSTVAKSSRQKGAKTIKTKARTTKKVVKKKVTAKKDPSTAPKESKIPKCTDEEDEDEPHCFKCRATPTINKLAAEPGLYSSQCGHIYCKECVGGMAKCIKCKAKLANLWKIYL